MPKICGKERAAPSKEVAALPVGRHAAMLRAGSSSMPFSASAGLDSTEDGSSNCSECGDPGEHVEGDCEAVRSVAPSVGAVPGRESI